MYRITNACEKKNDELFLFSDGFADQKGGAKNEKFFYQNFRDLLVACSNHPMQEQENFIQQTFTDWKKDNEQLDDVTVVGMVL